ncbi:hypothetical protein ACC862_03400 [Rhizobium ruizarguesonis]
MDTAPANVCHTPWVGDRYQDGINGRSVMIVGNSHWLGDNEADSEGVTLSVVGKVVEGAYKIAFFDHVRNYFGFAGHAAFWSRVIFLNYAPWAVGTGDRRYDHLTWEMAEAGKARFKSMIADRKPDIAFVFSRKIQWALPEMEFMDVSLPLQGARVGFLKEVPNTRIVILRHPQGAPKRQMIEALDASLAMP